jgi:hypothetical protein
VTAGRDEAHARYHYATFQSFCSSEGVRTATALRGPCAPRETARAGAGRPRPICARPSAAPGATLGPTTRCSRRRGYLPFP